MKLIKGFKVTKLDNIIAGILFIMVVAMPAHLSMANWQVFTLYVVASITVLGCWRLSYLRGKDEKTTTS